MPSPKEALDLLVVAKARIANPAQWCQNSPAKDSQGDSVPPSNPSARSWCMACAIAVGAQVTLQSREVEIVARRYLRLAIGDHSFGAIGKYNDDPRRTHGEAMAMYTKAIRLALEDSTKPQSEGQ